MLSGRDAIEAKRSANLWQIEIFRGGEQERTGAPGAYRENVMGCAVVHASMIAVENVGRVSEALRSNCVRVWVDKGDCLAGIWLASLDSDIMHEMMTSTYFIYNRLFRTYFAKKVVPEI